jgi:hypothetical protein
MQLGIMAKGMCDLHKNFPHSERFSASFGQLNWGLAGL